MPIPSGTTGHRGNLRLKKWWVLLVTTSATSLVFLDNTVMPVALPTIQKQFNFSEIGLLWVVNSYLLSIVALLLVGGRLSDLFGKRKLYLWGLSIFAIGSLLGAFSFSSWSLLLARVLQGIGGALVVPTTTSLLIATFGKKERAKAIGINIGISSIFLILGPAVGGFLTQYLSWRAIFWINMPIVLFGLGMTLWIVKPEKRKHESFHFFGALCQILGIVALIVGLMQSNEWGWSSPWTLSLLGISPLFLGLFVWISLHEEHPLLDFSIFHSSVYTKAILFLFLCQLVISVTVLWAIYFQQQLHYSPSQTGGIIFLATLPVMFLAPLGGLLSDRYGAKLPISLGFAILSLSLMWLVGSYRATEFYVLLPGLIGFGCAIPLIMSPTVALGLSQVDGKRLGAASAISTSTRQLGSTIGIALMSALFHSIFIRFQSYQIAFAAISIAATVLALIGFGVSTFAVKFPSD